MAMIERKGIIEFKGKQVSVAGMDVKIRKKAKDFHATKQDWSEIAFLESSTSKMRIIAAVPSLDTSVCDLETRRFNAEFGKNFGCLMIEPRLLRRAVFIVDKYNIIRYAKYMFSLKQEPDYSEVLADAKSILQK
jgi:thiol peroxidase